MKQVEILGVRIHSVTFDEAILEIKRMVGENQRGYVVTPTVDHMVKLRTDAEFREVYANASLVVADGMPILWASKFLGTPLAGRVCGSDLFPALCECAAERGWRVYFLGGMPGVAEKAAEALRRVNPSIQVVGTYSPPFGFEKDEAENRKIIAQIREARPDVLFVGLGAPKQEKWMYRYRNEHGAVVTLGIGISFDFVAGTLVRAPRWLQNIGLEWLWRVMAEPKRLWKRYLVEDPVFFWWVFRERLRGAKGGSNGRG
jgi:N-acetylglucosaminyldiphosphoundecaprenol N-acetyl-beta-D-mannosaminyltransferase